ncbi:uncharacterized transmembrane protein DDB_G0289901-like [Pollicipes pollicipes]|uniref:uncharacterized transmembrane protein DDB_G0289901-like n=1 Tax=Pollicipes pollicipes TaxID=41117 RepID=UPI001884E7CF|nr:uncharacterized transmembrane protein DDB_G0289901-like [Pollicipes pollicipes]
MLSALLLWIGVAAVVAVPVPTGNSGPLGSLLGPTPNCNISSESSLGQSGRTAGNAAVSGTTSTSGSASGLCGFQSPIAKLKDNGAVNSGVTGTVVSAGFGSAGQQANSKGAVGTTPGGTTVTTTSGGSGGSNGGGGVSQGGGANAGATKKKVVVVVLADGQKVVKLEDQAEGSGTSSSGHKASSTHNGVFNIQQGGETKIKLPPPLTG